MESIVVKDTKFTSVDEAIQRFYDEGLNYKYDCLWCYINGKYTCVMGSSMAEDYMFVGSLEEIIINFLDSGNINYSDGIAVDLSSELRDQFYDLAEKWKLFDIVYVTDTF